MYEKYLEAAEYIKARTKHRPKIAVVLGSGLSEFGDELKDCDIINYDDIPGFSVSSVSGHKSRLVISPEIICLQGRIHYYEGHTMNEVTFAVRVMKLLGVETYVLTNAAGGINTSFKAGDIMLITDHINFMGTNPLIGTNYDDFGVRFPDMTYCYNSELISLAEKTAKEVGVQVKKGVYAAMTGPSYETPAEIRMLRILGADAVGMSTVPEAIAACHCGMRILGISCITNMAAGVLDKPLNHSEVIETSRDMQENFMKVLRGTILRMAEKPTH